MYFSGSVPHSLSPYPSEEEEAYFRQVPQPGFPTPPKGLKLEHRGNSALVLRWQQSKILDGDGKEVNKPLLGKMSWVGGGGWLLQSYMGLNVRKPDCCTGTTKMQTSLNIKAATYYQGVSGYNQEVPQSHTADQFMAP